jgi:hypothetical protein
MMAKTCVKGRSRWLPAGWERTNEQPQWRQAISQQRFHPVSPLPHKDNANLVYIQCLERPALKLSIDYNFNRFVFPINRFVKPNIAAEWVLLVIRNGEVLGSNISSVSGYSDWGFPRFSSVLQTIYAMAPSFYILSNLLFTSHTIGPYIVCATDSVFK